MVQVHQVSGDDWEPLRDIRLAALSEAPYAFGSTYAREAAFTEQAWRGRLSERSATFFAYAAPATAPQTADYAGVAASVGATGPAGVTGSAQLAASAGVTGSAQVATSAEVAGPAGTAFRYVVAGGPGPAGLAGVVIEDGAADLVSMYVRPGARGLGVGAALIEASAAWARSRGYQALFLWVTEANGSARRLYDRCGFTPTGERQPLPSDPTLPEIRMSRPL